ncbi:MAG: hypothetical protein PF495_20615 [Spirochaetales bacterium]|jgi:hypothetical protein|nr:hypothetical protein [Spirochaetales bacterium]
MYKMKHPNWWPQDAKSRADLLLKLNCLSVGQIDDIIRIQDDPNLLEEEFAFFFRFFVKKMLDHRELKKDEWNLIFNSSETLISGVVRRNYTTLQKQPNVYLKDDGIRMKEIGCYDHVFRSLAQSNLPEAKMTLKRVRDNDIHNQNMSRMWDDIEKRLESLAQTK